MTSRGDASRSGRAHPHSSTILSTKSVVISDPIPSLEGRLVSMEGIPPQGATRLTQVRFYFDPSCPFAWIASRWMFEVQRLRPLDLEFRLVSLSVINEHREIDAWYREFNERAWGPSRVVAAIAADQGADAVQAFYTAAGCHIHVQGDKDFERVIPVALDEVGLPGHLATAANDPAWDEALRASTREALDPIGEDLGTPVIHVEDVAFFGPVLTSIPRGEEALRVFDAVRTLAGYPDFAELKRSRNDDLRCE